MSESKKKPDLAERIYRRLFCGHSGRSRVRGKNAVAQTVVIWPDPRPNILRIIREELSK